MTNFDPQPGETWEHLDGGSLYVVGRSGPLVRVQRRPFGDSQAIPQWMKVKTFEKLTKWRLVAR